MNRTQKKQAKKAQAAQMAAVLEMRALVHDVARELYARRAAPGASVMIAHQCISDAITFVDALNSFVPAGAPSSPMPPPELREAVAAQDAQLDAEGEGRELARDAVAELVHEPGSDEEMEEHS